MTKKLMTAILLTAGLALSQGAAAALPAVVGDQSMPTLAPLVKQVSPAVVSIATRGTVNAPPNPLMDDPVFRRFFGVPPQQQQQRRREVRSAGSGVIVDAKNGYVLTNHHVIENADEIEVILEDNRNLKATVVGSDDGTDIAVLKLKDPGRLTQIALGNSDQVQVGDFVVAIGNPFGLQHTVTSGIVSALGRSGISPDGYEDFIQTDASINPGNSGGALINLRGELIGINSAIFSNSGGNIGIGFAIPVNIAKSIMAQILQHGKVRRGLLGVSISDFSADTAKAYGVEAHEGALVQEVAQGSAAEKAGVQVGDVIVAVDGEPVRSASSLRATIGVKRSGDKVQLDLIREGKKRSVTAQLDEREAADKVAATDIHPGLAGAELANYTGEGGGFNGPAVQVVAVEPDSPAGARGLRQNDLIIAVNRVRVRSVKELQAAASQQTLLILSVRRGSRDLLLQVR
ncbi:MAG: DegQ family serine endoprotease [Gammaproteobacteria bacterium]|nr:DegQ family serine endoprotease [Gammaproteobacteria bacterium]